MNESAVCGRCRAPLETPGAPCPACLFDFGLDSNRGRSVGPGFLDDLPEQDTGLTIGQYRLTRLIARGGMGTVYEGRQKTLDRRVAVKVITAGAFADPAMRERFKQEARAAARLQHPNIVAIHDTGEEGDQPFISMEYIDGDTLQDRIRDRPMDARSAATILEAVCCGLQHAHENHVLHRDLKPSNVLLDRNGQPKITDFGLAAVVGSDSDLTRTGQALGSPGFLPPEQVSAKNLPAGPASDVYGAGATLYALLTARPPFAADTIAKTLRQVAEDDPVSPRRLNSSIPPDLETICLKCLQKQPARRYASARELGEDLKRFLAGEPIRARKVGTVEKVVRWCVKHPGIAVAILGLFGAMGLAVVTARARASEAAARRGAEMRVFMLNNQYVQLTERSSGWFSIISNALPTIEPEIRVEVQKQMAGALIGPDATQIGKLPEIDPTVLWKLPGEPTLLIPGRARSYPGDDRAVLKVWNQVTDESRLYPLRSDGHLVFALISNNVPLQLIPHPTNQLSYSLRNLAVQEIWREFTLPPESRPDPNTALSEKPEFTLSLDGRWFTVAQPVSLTQSLGMLFAFDVVRGELAFSTNYPHVTSHGINTTAVSPDGQILVAGHDDGRINLWSLGSHRQWRTLRDNGAQIRSLQYYSEQRNDSSDRKTKRWLLAARDDSGTVVIWDLETLLPRTRFYARPGDLIEFSPDGSTAVTAGHRVDLWDVATGRRLLGLAAEERQYGVAFSEDQRRLFIAGDADRVSVWGIEAGRGTLTLRGLRSSVTDVCISGDGRRIAAFSRNREVAVWNLADGRLVRVWEDVPHELKGYEAALALNHDGSELAYASEGSVKWWRVDSGQPRGKRWRLRPAIGNMLGFADIDGTNTLVLFRQENTSAKVVPYPEADPADFPRTCRLYHVTPRDDEERLMLDLTNFNHVANSILGSSDGRFFVVDGNCATANQTNRMLSCIDGWNSRVLWTRTLGSGHPDGEGLRIDSTGRLLIVTDNSSAVGVWIDLASGTILPRRVTTYPLALGPRGENWVTWNQREERGLLLFEGNGETPAVTLGINTTSGSSPEFDSTNTSRLDRKSQPVFSPDGQTLAVGQPDGSVLVFRMPEIQERMTKLGLGW